MCVCVLALLLSNTTRKDEMVVIYIIIIIVIFIGWLFVECSELAVDGCRLIYIRTNAYVEGHRHSARSFTRTRRHSVLRVDGGGAQW